MEKRLFAAILVSSILILVWSAFFGSSTRPVTNTTVANLSVQAVPGVVAPVVRESSKLATNTVRLDNFELEIVESAAEIKCFRFEKYKLDNFVLNNSFYFRPSKYTPGKQGTNFISFESKGQDLAISKKITLNKNYSGSVELTIQNTSNNSVVIDSPLVLGEIAANHGQQGQFLGIAVGMPEKTEYFGINKSFNSNEIKYVALKDQYFCLIAGAGKYFRGLAINNPDKKAALIALTAQNLILKPGEKIVDEVPIYVGPQDIKAISAVNRDWAAIINYGTFDVISNVLVQILDFLHRVSHNWGLAIILLSVIVYIVLFPLTVKQMRAMKEMQVLQPKIEALKKQYKDNPQKLNQAIMELYREHKVNPLGGCLPVVLQIPIFFALYQALIRSIYLKGAPFLWIKDLSLPDRLVVFPGTYPLIGNELNILPLIMAVGMFFQQKMSMASVSGSAAEQQRMMLVIMPIVFGAIFYRMPSGLVLYWFVNSALALAYQIWTKKK